MLTPTSAFPATAATANPILRPAAPWTPAGPDAVGPPTIATLRLLCDRLQCQRRVVRGGVRYRSGVLRRAATPPHALRMRFAGALRREPVPAGGGGPLPDDSRRPAAASDAVSSAVHRVE